MTPALGRRQPPGSTTTAATAPRSASATAPSASLPTPGTTSRSRYRVGGGVVGNVAADAIIIVTSGAVRRTSSAAPTRSPPPAAPTPRPPSRSADRAPQAFAANPLRVVRPADYVAAAESLPWVQQAGTTFRWTGSWLTAFTAADPAATETADADRGRAHSPTCSTAAGSPATRATCCRRATSRSTCRSRLCADPAYFAADVEEAVLDRTAARAAARRRRRFFDHTRWGFGAPLESSALLAAVQACPGVDGVHPAAYRQRGVSAPGRRCRRRSPSAPTRSCGSTTTPAARRPDR